MIVLVVGLILAILAPLVVRLVQFAVSRKREYLADASSAALAIVVTGFVAVMVIGTIGYMLLEQWDLIDSLYMTVITLTTVGYGDFSPETTAGKVFTIVYVLIGLGILVSFLGAVAGHAVEARVDRRRRRSRDEGAEGT